MKFEEGQGEWERGRLEARRRKPDTGYQVTSELFQGIEIRMEEEDRKDLLTLETDVSARLR